MTYQIGDIVKLKDASVVGVIYENGNKTFGDFRVISAGALKWRQIDEENLEPATQEELDSYTSQIIAQLKPEAVIANETNEAGGTLPAQLEAPPEPPPELENPGGLFN